jgi:hypothetical protein
LHRVQKKKPNNARSYTSFSQADATMDDESKHRSLAITHVAQNTRYDATTIQEFTNYVNEQIRSGGYLADCVVNIDETNIDFDMTGNITLADAGSTTISIRTNGSCNRCTVLLGVSLSFLKLPPFIIFKGKSPRLIPREWTAANTEYPRTSVYAIQVKESRPIICLWMSARCTKWMSSKRRWKTVVHRSTSL